MILPLHVARKNEGGMILFRSRELAHYSEESDTYAICSMYVADGVVGMNFGRSWQKATEYASNYAGTIEFRYFVPYIDPFGGARFVYLSGFLPSEMWHGRWLGALWDLITCPEYPYEPTITAEVRAVLLAELGERELKEALSGQIRDADEIVPFLQSHGVSVKTSCIEREVVRGLLTHTPYFSEMNVASPMAILDCWRAREQDCSRAAEMFSRFMTIHTASKGAAAQSDSVRNHMQYRIWNEVPLWEALTHTCVKHLMLIAITQAHSSSVNVAAEMANAAQTASAFVAFQLGGEAETYYSEYLASPRAATLKQKLEDQYAHGKSRA